MHFDITATDRLDYQLKQIDVETDIGKLVELFKQAFQMTINGVKVTARVAKRLTEMGHDVTMFPGMNRNRRDILINVAKGGILPEVYITFGDRPALLKLVTTLPETEQKRLTSGGTIKVWRSPDELDCVEVAPSAMDQSHFKQVFNESGGLRSYDGQVDYLNNIRHKPAPPVVIEDIAQVFDGYVVIGGKKVSHYGLLDLAMKCTPKKAR